MNINRVFLVNWEKNLEDVSKKLQDWRDETSKYYGDVSTSVSSSAKSPWDATVEALDNTGKKIKEFGIDIKEGSTKLYNDLVQTQSGAQSAIFNLYSLLTLIVVAYTFN